MPVGVDPVLQTQGVSPLDDCVQVKWDAPRACALLGCCGKSAVLILEPVWNEWATPLVSSICSHAPASVLVHRLPIHEDEQGMLCAAMVSQGPKRWAEQAVKASNGALAIR